MKNKSLIAIAFVLGIVLAAPVLTHADTTQTLLDAWRVVSGVITPRNTANTLRVPSLASGGDCVTTDGSGNFSTGPCGTGGGGSTTTIAGLTPSDGVFVFATGTATGFDLLITTTSPRTITFSPQLQSGYGISLTASSTNWNNLYNNVLSRLAVATGTTGNNFNISTSTNSLTINCPDASASNRGCLTSADFSTFSAKVSNAYASSTFPSFTYSSSTYVSFGYASSTFQLLGSYVTNAYASSTFPSFTYGSSTYVSFLYASSTFPSFTYASTTFPNVTLAGQNYLSLSGQQITANAITLSGSNVTGILPVANGGTATSTAPADNALFVGNGTSFYQSVLPSCSNSTTSKLLYNSATRAFTCGTDQTGGGGGSTTTITSNVQVDGPNFIFATSTTGSGTLKITGSSTINTLTFALDTSALQPAGSYVTNAYASSTFPSFAYTSSTFPSFLYATSTFQPLLTAGLDLNLVSYLSTLDSNLQKYLGEGYKSPGIASSTGWGSPNNIKVVDGSAATASVDGSDTGPIEALNFGFAIPTNAEILGIQVEWRKRRDVGGGCTMSDSGVYLLKASSTVGSDKSTGCWGTSYGYSTYGGPTDLWGTTWTPAQINSSSFGASLSAHDTGGNLYSLYIDHVRILVYYKSENQTVTVTGAVSGSGTSTIATSFASTTPIANGGTATTTTPTDGAVLLGNGTNWLYSVVPQCTSGQKIQYTTATRVFTCVTDVTGGSGGATTTITSDIQVDGPAFTFATSTTGSGTLKITGSGATVTFALDTSGLQPAGSYVTNTYASSTFPSFMYASSTFPSFTYATNTFQTILTNPVTGTGVNGQAAYWSSASAITSGAALLTNGTVVGVNATTSGVALTVKGISGNNAALLVSSSSGLTLFQITPAGIASTTSVNISALGTCSNGLVTTSGGTVACNGSAFLTGNQTITLSGAVTGSGATSITTSFDVGAFATGTTGNNFNIATTTSKLTINCPDASSANRGCLTTTDWSTFNNKQSALTNPDTGTGTIGKVARWSGATALTDASLLDNGTVAGWGATSTTIDFLVQGASGGTNSLFQLNTSTGTSLLTVSSNGTTTLAGTLNTASGTTLSELSFLPTVNISTNTTDNIISIAPLVASTASQTPATALYMQNVAPTARLLNSTTTITSFYGEYVGLTFATGTITSYYGTYIDAPSVTGSSTLTNAYGLVVAPTASTTKYTVFSGFGTTTPGATLVLQGSSGQSNDIFRAASSSGAVLFNVASSGNVGIGSTTPNALLTIKGVSGATTNLLQVTSSSDATLFVVKSSGNVGIGSSSPAALFTVDAGTSVGTASTTIVIPQKFQIDTYNSAGSRVCLDIRGTTLTVTSGACP